MKWRSTKIGALPSAIKVYFVDNVEKIKAPKALPLPASADKKVQEKCQRTQGVGSKSPTTHSGARSSPAEEAGLHRSARRSDRLSRESEKKGAREPVILYPKGKI